MEKILKEITHDKNVVSELIYLKEVEVLEVKLLIKRLKERFGDFQSPEFVQQARYYAFQLPERLVQAVERFRFAEGAPGVLLIKGFDYDDVRPTPTTMDESVHVPRTDDSDVFLVLLSTILGDLFGWSMQRNGDVINDMFPLPEHEMEQLSTGSKGYLEFHTEEAFHPYRADFLGLTCVRNFERAATTISAVKEVSLSEKSRQILFEPRFIFEKDSNFLQDHCDLEPEAVLFGSYENPFLRIDPAFMYAVEGDQDAADALKEIIDQLNGNMIDVILEPGDVCLVDNHAVVHGRRPFEAKYDGTGRWLKRVNIAIDLKKSRAMRNGGNMHVIQN